MKSTYISLLLCVLSLLTMNLRRAESQLSESAYLLTDKDVYMAGGRVYFTVWLKGTPDSVSEYLYLELIDADRNPVEKFTLRLDKGRYSGSFEISSGQASGFYLLRAYTGYHKAVDPLVFYRRKIMILNPDLNNRFRFPDREVLRRVQRVKLDFFPEGGKMVGGINSRLFIRSDNPRADAFKDAYISNSIGDTLAFLNKIDHSNAWAEFIPLFPPCYVNMPGLYPVQRTQVPGIERNATLLKLQPAPGRINFIVESTDTSMNLQDLEVEVRDVIRDSVFIRVPSATDMGVKVSELKGNLLSFMLRDPEGNVLSEIPYYQPIKDFFSINAELGAREFSSREKVVLELSLPEGSGRSSDLAVLVRKKLPDVAGNHGIEYSPLLDPAGLIKPEWDREVVLSGLALGSIYHDSILNLVQSLAARSGNAEREKEAYLLKGRIENLTQPEGIPVFLSFPGDSSQVFISKTGPDGEFSFPGFIAEGNREVFLKTADSITTGFLSLDNPFYPGYSAQVSWPDSLSEEFRIMAEEMYRNHRINSVYRSERLPERDDGSPPRIFDVHDFRLEMANFVELPNMEEVFFEIVKQIMFFRNNGDPYVQVVDRTTNRTLGRNTLYIVDGVPLTRPQLIFTLDPNTVRDINIIARKIYIGAENFDGLVIINTYDNDFSPVEYEGSLLRQDYSFPMESMDRDPLPFTLPELHIPDRRDLLLWKPEVKVNGNETLRLEFFTSDLEGEFEVLITGYDMETGRSGKRILEFRVKN